jgi:DNA-binding CsgD family transcriptional regulator
MPADAPVASNVRNPACWVALRCAAINGAPSIADLRETFGFTQKQADLVRDLVMGHTVEEHVRRRGITANGGNYHVGKVFKITGCERQHEVVQLVLATFGPFVTQRDEKPST